MNIKYRIRKKGEIYVLEELNESTIKSKTLNPKKLWSILNVSENVSENVSNSTQEQDSKVPQKFGQDLLTEPQETPENKTQLKDWQEEIKKLGVFK